MKQTAVEWLFEQVWITSGEDLPELLEQAKELEKEQAGRMYSEEELKSAFKIGFNIGYGSPVSELDLKEEHCTKWFGQFKKK